MLRYVFIAALAMLTAACASTSSPYSGSNGKTLYVAKKDWAKYWAKYQEYLTHVGGTNPGVFAVVVVGDHTAGSGYSVCPEAHCLADSGINPMMNECKAEGLTCIVFAQSSSILVNYKIDE